MTTTLPPAFAAMRDEFQALTLSDRVQLLLEFSDSLPEVPPELLDDHALEHVPECQAPVAILVRLVDGRVEFYARVPREAPTTRGFAAILAEGMRGLTAREALEIPSGFPQELGLEQAISPLRLRGMNALLERSKAQIRSQQA